MQTGTGPRWEWTAPAQTIALRAGEGNLIANLIAQENVLIYRKHPLKVGDRQLSSGGLGTGHLGPKRKQLPKPRGMAHSCYSSLGQMSNSKKGTYAPQGHFSFPDAGLHVCLRESPPAPIRVRTEWEWAHPLPTVSAGPYPASRHRGLPGRQRSQSSQPRIPK